MEEYTTLADLVQNEAADEPDYLSDTSEELSVTVIPWDQDVPTSIPAPIAEIVDTVKESADQPVNQAGSSEAEQTALPGADQGAIIIVIPGETDDAKPADSSGQTVSDKRGQKETQHTATVNPVEKEPGNQRADNEQPMATNQPQPAEKAATSPKTTDQAQESPSASSVIETPTPQPVPQRNAKMISGTITRSTEPPNAPVGIFAQIKTVASATQMPPSASIRVVFFMIIPSQ